MYVSWSRYHGPRIAGAWVPWWVLIFVAPVWLAWEIVILEIKIYVWLMLITITVIRVISRAIKIRKHPTVHIEGDVHLNHENVVKAAPGPRDWITPV